MSYTKCQSQDVTSSWFDGEQTQFSKHANIQRSTLSTPGRIKLKLQFRSVGGYYYYFMNSQHPSPNLPFPFSPTNDDDDEDDDAPLSFRDIILTN